VAISKADAKLLVQIACAYEGSERTRLYGLVIAQKLFREACNQNIPNVPAVKVTAESSEEDLAVALKRLGYPN